VGASDGAKVAVGRRLGDVDTDGGGVAVGGADGCPDGRGVAPKPKSGDGQGVGCGPVGAGMGCSVGASPVLKHAPKPSLMAAKVTSPRPSQADATASATGEIESTPSRPTALTTRDSASGGTWRASAPPLKASEALVAQVELTVAVNVQSSPAAHRVGSRAVKPLSSASEKASLPRTDTSTVRQSSVRHEAAPQVGASEVD